MLHKKSNMNTRKRGKNGKVRKQEAEEERKKAAGVY
jgi:hypothetical protein